MDKEGKKLIDDIMVTFPKDTDYEALQYYIILQEATKTHLEIVNAVLNETMENNQGKMKHLGKVSLVRENPIINLIIDQLQEILPSEFKTSKEDIIKKALLFMLMTSRFTKEEQQMIAKLMRKYFVSEDDL